MSHAYLIVGKPFSSLTKQIEKRGDSWILLKDSPGNTRSDDSDTISADFSDMDNVVKVAGRLKGQVDGVITIYENYIHAASIIADALELPGLPVSAALACTDKVAMRKLFAKSPQHISPDFVTVNTIEDIRRFASTHEFPLILKPANLVKSLLVMKCNNLAEAESNYETIKQQIAGVYQKFAPHEKPKLLIEEFLQGSIHSVDAFVDNNGEPLVLEQIVDYKTGHDIGYQDNFHYSRILPSQLSLEDQKNLRQVAALGCKALGIKNSAAHIEIIMTKNGPKIVEIGARNGGYRERMHKLANGFDVLDIQLDIKVGKPILIHSTKSEPCAVLELFPKVPGKFIGINNEAALKSLPSLNYYKIKQQIGNFVGKAGDGYKMCAIIIIHNSNRKQFEKDRLFVERSVYVTSA